MLSFAEIEITNLGSRAVCPGIKTWRKEGDTHHQPSWILRIIVKFHLWI